MNIINYLTTIHFGAGAIASLAETLRDLGVSNPLLISDHGVKAVGLLDNQALQFMRAAPAFLDVPTNPTEAAVRQALVLYRQRNCDGVVAIGGGSPIDLAKGVALLATHSGDLEQYAAILGGIAKITSAVAPLVAVPTTAGTGSEVGRASVITNSQTHVKKIIFHPKFLPGVVICDPELTVGMPKVITAGTGMDAFAHCLEAYCSPFFHPMSQGIALEGMRLVKEFLPRAHRDGTDIEARTNMMAAAAMGAVAFQKGLGAIHALSHPIGAVYNTHHGMTNAVVMPPVLRFNRPAIEDKLARAAAYLGISGGFDGFYDYVLSLRSELGVPDTLTAMGITPDRIDELAAMAIEDPSCGGNPVPMTLENTRQLFLDCF